MTYTSLNTLFEQYDGAVSAAEAHGIASGMLCVDIRSCEAEWLQEVLRDAEPLHAGQREMLSALFERTRRLLQEDGCEFDLLLPGEDASLQQQAEALRDWCQGFLFGIGYSRSNGDWPGESGEILQDIMQISRLDAAAEGEEDENALMQIQEFLRAAVLILQQEFK
jgi:uncharacterized protein YgfB (UPF0149 family)